MIVNEETDNETFADAAACRRVGEDTGYRAHRAISTSKIALLMIAVFGVHRAQAVQFQLFKNTNLHSAFTPPLPLSVQARARFGSLCSPADKLGLSREEMKTGRRRPSSVRALEMQVQKSDKNTGSKASAPKTNSDDSSDSPKPQGDPNNIAAWVGVILLLAINVHNQWTRALVYYVINFNADATPENKNVYMNLDIGFDKEQYSILASFGFTALYTICSLFAGRAADKFDRAKVVIAATGLWSLSTVGQAMSTSFDSVLGFRALMGVSQAFVGPQAYGLISSLFPSGNVATPNSVYASGVYLGGALASLSILLDQQLGWRETSLAAGGIGGGLVLVSLFLLRDPRNQQPQLPAEVEVENKAATATVNVHECDPLLASSNEALSKDDENSMMGAVDAVKTVLSSRFVQILFLATAFRFCAGYGIGVWKAPFYREAFPDFASQFSVLNAFVISGGGILSSLLGGLITDKFSPKDKRVSLWVPAVGCLLAVPLWIGVCEVDNFYLSIGLLFLEYIAAECWFGPTVASLYEAVPKEVQGTAQGLFTVLTAVGNLMPVIIGSLQKDYGLPDTFAFTVSVAYVLSSVFFFQASNNLPQKSTLTAPK